MQARIVETRRGAKVRVFEAGRGEPIVFLHGAGGLFDENPCLDRLAARFRVLAPEWPGYGESSGEDTLEDMLDFTLHGWDVVDALGLTKPHLVGHSMGGMIAAEMACIAPKDLGRLVLVAPAGLWIDAHPIPDLFATLPFELPALLFHDASLASRYLLDAGLDFHDPKAVEKFFIDNAKKLGTAGRILFPIPNRRLSKRLYRLEAPTRILWGRSDRLIPPVYAERWQELVPHAQLAWVEEAGHMLPYEKPDEFAVLVAEHLS